VIDFSQLRSRRDEAKCRAETLKSQPRRLGSQDPCGDCPAFHIRHGYERIIGPLNSVDGIILPMCSCFTDVGVYSAVLNYGRSTGTEGLAKPLPSREF
jgi:hypothetical protein